MRSIFTATVIAAALSACGGGGGGDSSTDSSGKAAAVTSIGQMGGTYVLPCKGETFELSKLDGRRSESREGTIVITPDSGTGSATISMHSKYYKNSANCDSAALDFDMTFRGTATDAPGSKTYTNAAGKPVTAKVVTIAYAGFTLSKGNLDFALPTPGATTNMAYVVENNTLYVSKGRREADGLGDALAPGAVKQ